MKSNNSLKRNRIEAFFLLLLFLVGLAQSVYSASSYQINNGSYTDINEWSTCRRVTNNSPTGLAIFVSTNSSSEWASFYNQSPVASGISISTCNACTAATISYSTAGSYSWTVPTGCTQMTVYSWGGGGGGGYGGGSSSGGNGGSGGYAKLTAYTISQSQIYNFTVGQSGRGGNTNCTNSGKGGTGSFAGGDAAQSAAGTSGAGSASVISGGVGADGGTAGAAGRSGGGGGGSTASNRGGGGGGATALSLSGGSNILIAGGGGGGGGRDGSGATVGAGGAGCSSAGVAAGTGGANPKAGGGGAGQCTGSSTGTGSGVTPYTTAVPFSLPAANAVGGTGNGNGSATCNSGGDGFLLIDYQ